MGLDITAYNRTTLMPEDFTPPTDEHGDRDYDYLLAWAYDGFEQSTRGLAGMDLPSPYGTGFGTRWYSTKESDEHRFRAGSYSGYNTWRRDLATFVGYPDNWQHTANAHHERPFFELIWFADNEGTIGPEAARDLLADFQHHRPAYAAEHNTSPDGEWYLNRYDDWTRACELAADAGLIDFH